MNEVETLETIRTKIEAMDKERHIQALNILAKYPSIVINEPKYGDISVNLSRIPQEAVSDLLKFISYVEEQETTLMKMEIQKKEYQSTFFSGEEGESSSNAEPFANSTQ